MKAKLIENLNNSYAPYSNFKVSAAVVMDDGSVFYGVNVENASFGATICAERNAINNAILNGYKKGDFRELHVLADKKEEVFPCFICRQVITEFFNNDDKIITHFNNEEKTYLVSEMTPYPFKDGELC